MQSLKQSDLTSLRTIKTVQLPDIDWVEIPAGAFIYGDASSQQSITLERFFISRYPITNCQYQTFIDAGGYDDNLWWQDLEKPVTKTTAKKHDNRPKDNVTWDEALAFSRWLSVQFGFEVTLPTEQQWEKAARGTDGREYPWGASLEIGDANVRIESETDSNIGQSSAVGLFLHRPSPFGIMDMAGNVWEFCHNSLNNGSQTNDIQILRGGSWSHTPVFAKCYERKSARDLSVLRYYSNADMTGFRITCFAPHKPIRFTSTVVHIN